MFRALFLPHNIITLVVVVLFGLISTFLYLADQVPPTPRVEQQKALGVDLEEAFRDLQLITARPHPYHSRANDRVREYILQRVNGIAKGHAHVEVDDDVRTAANFIDGAHASYFEGSNILVKVDGWDNSSEASALLFSAHFDSVSTAPGVTDDGMALVALLQMVSYLAANRPRRTAIFNINNGEEDGLNGAHAFLQHPWSNLTSAFLNFEGAGAGGRPLLFRATLPPPDGLNLLDYFSRAYVSHPHANALSSDAFSRGVVRSGTDFAVYSGPRDAASDNSSLTAEDDEMPVGMKAYKEYKGRGLGLPGADIAFYKHRARYHTPDDSIATMGGEGEGARRALWAVMEIMRGGGGGILDADGNKSFGGSRDERDGKPMVYFELLATYLIILSRGTVFGLFIALLVAGPLSLAGLYYLAPAPAIRDQQVQEPTQTHQDLSEGAAPSTDSVTVRQSDFTQKGTLFSKVRAELKDSAPFWKCFLLCAAAQAALVTGYVRINPYTIHAHPLAVVLSVFSLSYITLLGPFAFLPLSPAPIQSFATLSQLYVFTWLLVLGATILMGKVGILGLYWIEIWNACVGLGLIMSIIEQRFGGRSTCSADIGRTPSIRVSEPSGDEAEPQSAEDATEATPLVSRPPVELYSAADVVPEFDLISILRILITVPIPVILLGTVVFLWMGALAQTVTDGGWVGVVYIPLSLLSGLILLTLTPFAQTLHRWLTCIAALLFIASTLYAYLVFPFNTMDGKLKLFWEQRVDLANFTVPSSGLEDLRAVRAMTQVTAVPAYGAAAVQDLPSVKAGANFSCADSALRRGLKTCSWTVGSAWAPAPSAHESTVSQTWLSVNATRLGDAKEGARFAIAGTNARACRVYLDTRRVVRYRVLQADGAWSEFEVPAGQPIKEVRLWSRTWDREFVVEVWWDTIAKAQEAGDAEEPVRGRVACDWAEYSGAWPASAPDSGHAGAALQPEGARIPALEEALLFLPPWAVLSKMGDGLVEAVAGFTLL